MSNAVSNQIRKRRAVAEALERQKIFICSRRFSEEGTIIRVLIAGEYYDVSNLTLAALREGASPQQMHLQPAADEAYE